MYASSSTRPVRRATSAIAITEAWLAASGFSHSTCLPASRAAMASDGWVVWTVER